MCILPHWDPTHGGPSLPVFSINFFHFGSTFHFFHFSSLLLWALQFDRNTMLRLNQGLGLPVWFCFGKGSTANWYYLDSRPVERVWNIQLLVVILRKKGWNRNHPEFLSKSKQCTGLTVFRSLCLHFAWWLGTLWADYGLKPCLWSSLRNGNKTFSIGKTR